MLEVVRAGGLGSGGFNFDAKIRRQSTDLEDLLHAHVGGVDTMAHALLIAERIVQDGRLDSARAARYAGWDGEFGQRILAGKEGLDGLAGHVETAGAPVIRSGRQEALENLVARLS